MKRCGLMSLPLAGDRLIIAFPRRRQYLVHRTRFKSIQRYQCWPRSSMFAFSVQSCSHPEEKTQIIFLPYRFENHVFFLVSKQTYILLIIKAKMRLYLSGLRWELFGVKVKACEVVWFVWLHLLLVVWGLSVGESRWSNGWGRGRHHHGWR